MRDTIEVYHWEDDPEAESLLDELKEHGLKYEVELLDAEDSGSTPCVRYKGKTYWSFDEFLATLKETGS